MSRRYTITEEDYAFGVQNTMLAVVENVSITRELPPALEQLREQALGKALAYSDDDLAASGELEGFRRLYQKLGYAADLLPAAEDFVHLLRRRQALPQINTAVDAYNTVVLDTLMGIGAHDLDLIQGDVVFMRSLGTERFTPLGKSRAKNVPAGDFIYRDDEKVLARLASDDCDEAKIQSSTKNILLVIEAHALVTPEFVSETIRRAAEAIVEFCGGTFTTFAPVRIE